VFFEMLTGFCPFMGNSEMGILERVRAAVVPPPSSYNPAIPGQLEAVVLKALRKEPLERYQDAGELLQDLDSYLRGRPAVGSTGLAAFMKELFEPGVTVPASAGERTDPAAGV
jgi:serine/threonine-protein kinase